MVKCSHLPEHTLINSAIGPCSDQQWTQFLHTHKVNKAHSINCAEKDAENGVRNNAASPAANAIEHDDAYADCHPDSLFELVVKGNAFLYHQIRCIVGVLMLIGRGLEDESIVDTLLDVDKCPDKPTVRLCS